MKKIVVIFVLLLGLVFALAFKPSWVFPLTLEETNSDGKMNPVFVLNSNAKAFTPVDWEVVLLTPNEFSGCQLSKEGLGISRPFDE